jgi:dTDP-4-dehydrorhamnose reductase
MNQALGTALAMRAIRREIPDAQLIQTEDLGHVRSTPDLAYQADFENERRFLSLDLLLGRMTSEHPLYEYLRENGIAAHELSWLAENPCAPDVVGFNYYVTGERYLDSRCELYPPHVVGGNAEQRYADVEAVRVCRSGLRGPCELLVEAYQRLGVPLAVTEAHLAGPPEDRARWFSYVWSSAEAARQRGVPVAAVTAWALLGSYGWDRLVTEGPCSYEVGAFEVAAGELLETPYASFLRALSRGTACIVDGGWWRSGERLSYSHTDAEITLDGSGGAASELPAFIQSVV